MLNILCKLGIHKWEKAKQWVGDDGKVVFKPRCKKCAKLKK
jgi:hypothetical protein